MSYEMVTLDIFKKKLKSGKYVNLTGAKRALGRVQQMTDADKIAAVKAATRHFGAPVAPKKTAKKKG
jgi:hypothetical protein